MLQLRGERQMVPTGPLLMVLSGLLPTVDRLMWALSQNYKVQPRRLQLFYKWKPWSRRHRRPRKIFLYQKQGRRAGWTM